MNKQRNAPRKRLRIKHNLPLAGLEPAKVNLEVCREIGHAHPNFGHD